MRNLFKEVFTERMRYTISQEMDYDYRKALIASGYEPFDYAAVYDYPPDIPPPELVEAREKNWSAYDTFHSIIERKIGNTWYTILTDCDGKESLVGKVKRLIFSEPLPRMEAIPR